MPHTPTLARWMLIIIALLGLVGCDPAPAGYQRVIIQGERFDLELAVTPEAREKGLMGRESVPEDGGMLFVFPDLARRGFWMKNCLTDIDLIFLDARGNVTAVHAMTPEPLDTPDSQLTIYSSDYPAQFAVELRGGKAAELGVEPGERIDLPLEKLKRLAR